MRRLLLVLPLLGCGQATNESAGDGGVGLATCKTPIEGSAPFSTVLHGNIPSETGTRGTSLEVYFPNGRIAGSDVIFAWDTTDGRVLRRERLDATLSAAFSFSDLSCGDQITGTLVGPSGGVDATLKVNVSGLANDNVHLETGRTVLCPVGPTSAPVGAAPSEVLPLEQLIVQTNVPLDVTSFSTITATPTRSLNVSQLGTSFVVAPALAPFTKATIDFGDVRDILGRRIALKPTRLGALSEVLTDPTLSSPPPAGTVLGSYSIDAGVLYVDSSSRRFLLGLGTATTAKKVRLRHRMNCTSGTTTPSISLVSESGLQIGVKVDCASTLVESTIALPADGRWALSAVTSVSRSRPCNYPSPRTTYATYELDDVLFE